MSPLNRDDREAFLKAIEEVAESTAPAGRPSGQDASEQEYDLDSDEKDVGLDPEEVGARIAIVDAQQRDSVLSPGGFLKSAFKKMLLLRGPWFWRYPWV